MGNAIEKDIEHITNKNLLSIQEICLGYNDISMLTNKQFKEKINNLYEAIKNNSDDILNILLKFETICNISYKNKDNFINQDLLISKVFVNISNIFNYEIFGSDRDSYTLKVLYIYEQLLSNNYFFKLLINNSFDQVLNEIYVNLRNKESVLIYCNIFNIIYLLLSKLFRISFTRND